MEKSQMKQWLTSRNAVVLILGVLATYFVVTSLVDARFHNVETSIRGQIFEQESLLTAIAEATSRNGADAITESIVKDCTVTERSQFDNLLSRLNNNLTRSELVELERLFGRCGTFFSERKNVMVSRLSREIEIYKNFVDQLSVVKDEDLNEKFSVSVWQELASEEKKQSELFAELVNLQDSIIKTLLSGKSAGSPEIVEILQQVQEVQGTLIVTNKQTANVRSRLISL